MSTHDLRSHAIGQKVREMSDDIDPNAASVLEAQERAAKPDREWQRLRRVAAAARRAVELWGQEGEDEALEALVAALEGQE